MNCFQLVKSVLDELYERIPAKTEKEKDKGIAEMMSYLRKQYAGLARGLKIDYTDPTTRFAYIYAYVTCHANIVYQLIQESEELANLLEQRKLNVTCVGGGPGSDFLGILKSALDQKKRELFLRCTLLDREPTWADCWNDVDEKLVSQLRITNNFQTFDVTDPKTWETISKYLGSDLFTMIYFMSEIDSLRKSAEPFFRNLFENANPGALFLYVDNNNRHFFDWFDSLVSENGLTVLSASEEVIKIRDFSEEKKDLGKYWRKFGNPRLTANAAYRICQKPMGRARAKAR